MNKTDIIRAWKDPAYRATLTPEQLACLPDHPAGIVEIGEDRLKQAGGGGGGGPQTTAPECTLWTDLRCCP